jgi:N-acetylglucosamine-6-sulfatase
MQPVARGRLTRVLVLLLLAALAPGTAAAAGAAPTSAAPTSAAPTHAAATGAATVVADRPFAGDPVDKRPNIVLVTTDDMRADEMRYMKRTRRLIGRLGVSYRNFLSPHPLCCPARAELLTGQYAQNNGVRHNGGSRGGYKAFRPLRRHHVGVWAQKAGYRTAFVGKFLNHYPRAGHLVPGWDVFDPAVRNAYQPFGLTMLNHGDPQTFPDVYTTDLVSRRTIANVKRFAEQGGPFLIYSSQIAPHGMKIHGRWVPPVPAPRHARLFKKAKAPSLADPSFNEADVRDKYVGYRTDRFAVRKANRLHRARIRSLQSVDQAVARLVRTLDRLDELDDTLIIFTSDNGYLLGEHRWNGKTVPYEQSLRVPLLMRGPSIPRQRARAEVRTLVDIAPTIVKAMKARPDVVMDGRPLTNTLRRRSARGYSSVLIQGGHDRLPWEYRGVRTDRYTYVRYHNGFVELFDRHEDPHQLASLTDPSDDEPTTRAARRLAKRLKLRLARLADCAGPRGCGASLRDLPRV